MRAQLLDVEGMAMSGLVEDVEIVEEGDKAYLRVKTKDGKIIESEEAPREVVAKSYFIVLQYLKWGRQITGQ